MEKSSHRIRFYMGLLALCGLYWLVDSVWSFVSFERNLQALIYTEPTSLLDTFFLQVPPYQVVSRLIVIGLFLVSGVLLFESLTKKEGAEAALRESEEKYRMLVSHSNDAIFIAQDGRIKFPNPKTMEITGYTKEELREVPFESLIHPEDRGLVLERHKARLGGESPPPTYSFRIVNKLDRTVWVQLSTGRIQWGGRPATLNFLRDISEEKEMADRLQRAEKMEAVGTLAGGVAHDLNNILSGLVSYPDLLLLDIPEDSPLREPILTMQDSGKKAAMIVQDLLTLARRGVVSTDVVNLNDIVSEYLNSPEFKKLGTFHERIEVRTLLEPDLLNMSGSPVHLSKAVMNLVSNAAEASPGGGVITVSTSNRYIDRPVIGYDEVKEGDYVVLEVADTGEGISPEDMKRIFEPFYTKKVMGRSGTGLGMAVVWGTVKDHQGYIHLESTPGEGTKLSLFFPATRKEIQEKETPSLIEDLKGNRETILVVDDVEDQRRIASALLTKLDYVPHTVSSGEAAVSYMKDHSADLIILDMIMAPGMDGLDTYKAIRDIHPGQKALIASGYSETDRVKAVQRLGAGAYVKKPYTLEKIGSAVKAELDR